MHDNDIAAAFAAFLLLFVGALFGATVSGNHQAFGDFCKDQGFHDVDDVVYDPQPKHFAVTCSDSFNEQVEERTFTVDGDNRTDWTDK